MAFPKKNKSDSSAQSCPRVEFLQPNPTQPNKGLTQPNPTHRKVKTLDEQPITQSNSIQPTTNLRAHKEDNFNISQSVKVYRVLLTYQYLSLSGYQVLLQQSQEAYQVLEFLEMFLTYDPTQSN